MSRRFKVRRRGLSLVEVVISTAIAAALLTATGMAWVGSTNAVEVNDRMARGLQSGSTAVLQMTNAIRRCQSVTVASDHVDVVTYDGHNYTYQYDSASKQLWMINKDVTPNVTYPMAYDVTSCTFGADMAANPQTQVMCVVHVSFNFTISYNNCPFTLCGSAAPRVNINY